MSRLAHSSFSGFSKKIHKMPVQDAAAPAQLPASVLTQRERSTQSTLERGAAWRRGLAGSSLLRGREGAGRTGNGTAGGLREGSRGLGQVTPGTRGSCWAGASPCPGAALTREFPTQGTRAAVGRAVGHQPPPARPGLPVDVTISDLWL